MKLTTYRIREGYDGKRCLVHARYAATPLFEIISSQYLDVFGIDKFSGILTSIRYNGEEKFPEFKEETELRPKRIANRTYVPCDATPIYHKASGKLLLIGTAVYYEDGETHPSPDWRAAFYSIFNYERAEFSEMRFLEAPSEYENAHCGSGQCLELSSGEILIPITYLKSNEKYSSVVTFRCKLSGEKIEVLETGNTLTVNDGRGLCEPSLAYHDGIYYMTLREDSHGYLAASTDGLHYLDPRVWCFDDGNILENYNTQQHFVTVGNDLCLVYTRRAGNNSHVFRHRAPLFISRIENMRLVRESETVAVVERGARLGNFGAVSLSDGRGIVIAAEWMQPVGCEKYGSNNAIFLSELRTE